MNDIVYLKRKGIMYYVDSNDSYIVSYLLETKYKETIYIEKNNIDSLVSLLDKCHINYHYNNTVRFTDNKYMMYLKYGMLTKRIDLLALKLKECLYLDNIEEIISKMERFYD